MQLPLPSPRRLALFVVGTAFVAAPAVQALEGVQEGVPSQSEVETISDYNPHRVIVYDQDFPHLEATSAWFVDGDSGSVEGMIAAGYQSNIALSSDHERFYVTDTFYSRLTRGERTDVVTYYDTSTLAPVGETELPNGRFLIVQKKYNAGTSPDGQYLLSFNETPAMSVSVVDVKQQEYIGEIQSRGCWGIFPTAERRFISICPDGSLQTISFAVDDDGELTSDAEKSKSFFDPMKGTVFEAPGFGHKDHKLVFVSYEGEVHPVDVSGETPKFEDSWSILTDADEGWLPGGWQPLAYSSETKRLYVLMHEGGQWTHKFPGNQVWVFDTTTHERVQRIALDDEAASIAISPDDEQLYTLATETATLGIYDAHSGELKHELSDLGLTPMTLYTAKDM